MFRAKGLHREVNSHYYLTTNYLTQGLRWKRQIMFISFKVEKHRRYSCACNLNTVRKKNRIIGTFRINPVVPSKPPIA